MLINPKFEMRVSRSIDQSDPMFLSRCELEFGIFTTPIEFILPVNKTVACWTRWTGNSFSEVLLERSSMKEIADCNWSKINIPIRA
jgi:hypothetical protein